MLEFEIHSMYQQIIEYEGNFGDPIDTGSYNPFEMAESESLDADERDGVGVAILCHLTTAIDNTTYEDALRSEGKKVKLLASERILNGTTLIRTALDAFLISEADFLCAVDAVYVGVVVAKMSKH